MYVYIQMYNSKCIVRVNTTYGAPSRCVSRWKPTSYIDDDPFGVVFDVSRLESTTYERVELIPQARETVKRNSTKSFRKFWIKTQESSCDSLESKLLFGHVQHRSTTPVRDL